MLGLMLAETAVMFGHDIANWHLQFHYAISGIFFQKMGIWLDHLDKFQVLIHPIVMNCKTIVEKAHSKFKLLTNRQIFTLRCVG